MQRTTCILCGNKISAKDMLLSFANMPGSAQDIPTREQLDTDKGIDLNLYQCSCCGLVQLDAEPVAYYKHVIRAGGGSSTMINLRRQEYEDFMKRFDLQNKRVIEIGCGRGEFLKVWKEFPI